MGEGLGIERTPRHRKGYGQGSVEVCSGRKEQYSQGSVQVCSEMNGTAKEMEGKS